MDAKKQFEQFMDNLDKLFDKNFMLNDNETPHHSFCKCKKCVVSEQFYKKTSAVAGENIL